MTRRNKSKTREKTRVNIRVITCNIMNSLDEVYFKRQKVNYNSLEFTLEN